MWLSLESSGDLLINIRFADDIFLVAQSKCDIETMIGNFVSYANKFSLKLEFGKTKVMAWNKMASISPAIQVHGQGHFSTRKTHKNM